MPFYTKESASGDKVDAYLLVFDNGAVVHCGAANATEADSLDEKHD